MALDGCLVATCERCGLVQEREDLVHRGREATAETTRLPTGRVIRAVCEPPLPGFRAVGVSVPDCPGSPAAWADWTPWERPA